MRTMWNVKTGKNKHVNMVSLFSLPLTGQLGLCVRKWKMREFVWWLVSTFPVAQTKAVLCVFVGVAAAGVSVARRQVLREDSDVKKMWERLEWHSCCRRQVVVAKNIFLYVKIEGNVTGVFMVRPWLQEVFLIEITFFFFWLFVN